MCVSYVRVVGVRLVSVRVHLREQGRLCVDCLCAVCVHVSVLFVCFICWCFVLFSVECVCFVFGCVMCVWTVCFRVYQSACSVYVCAWVCVVYARVVCFVCVLCMLGVCCVCGV